MCDRGFCTGYRGRSISKKFVLSHSIPYAVTSLLSWSPCMISSFILNNCGCGWGSVADISGPRLEKFNLGLKKDLTRWLDQRMGHWLRRGDLCSHLDHWAKSLDCPLATHGWTVARCEIRFDSWEKKQEKSRLKTQNRKVAQITKNIIKDCPIT